MNNFDNYKQSLDSQEDLDSIAKKEHEEVLKMLEDDIKSGLIQKDGVRVMSELKKLGWNNVAYSSSLKRSKYTVKCVYSGSYQQSHLIKEFNGVMK